MLMSICVTWLANVLFTNEFSLMICDCHSTNSKFEIQISPIDIKFINITAAAVVVVAEDLST